MRRRERRGQTSGDRLPQGDFASAGRPETGPAVPDWADLCDALDPDDPDPLPEPGDFWIDDEA